jgi:hypothetical protein
MQDVDRMIGPDQNGVRFIFDPNCRKQETILTFFLSGRENKTDPFLARLATMVA